LRDVPTAPLDERGELGELTTPTGAALLAHFVHEFGPPPRGPVAAVGLGAGARQVPGRPNVLRVLIIEPAPQEETMDRVGSRDVRDDRAGSGDVRRTASGIAGGVRRVEPSGPVPAPVIEEQTQDQALRPDAATEGVAAEEVVPQEPSPSATPTSAGGAVEREETQAMHPDGHDPLDHIVLEANIDDMSPELLAHAADVLRDGGALDVWKTQALMKKGRPGVVLHVLATPADHRRLADLVFAETTTFGLRVLPVARLYAEERRETIKLGGHEIRVRLSVVDGRPATVAPEHEDCLKAADDLGRPAKVVYEAAQAAARARFSGS
jgi:uncharacterized protein (DUF111 family)